MDAEQTTAQVLEGFELDRLRDRFVQAGFEVSAWPFPDSHIAGHAVVVRAVDPTHVDRLEAHRLLTPEQILPTDRHLADWRLALAEAIRMLRVATGTTHADLGPTTQAEAAFAATDRG